ncbi:MAG TPA: thiolase family protein [Candidatus Limnocylindria bacterium]|jgi:acetyl-CoA acetyltransferase|nr:thiolase family protein [Candidatus Limnocylindria bacterium]
MREVAIVAYAETPIDVKTGRSAYDLAGEAFAALLASTGVPKAEIDGLHVVLPVSEGQNPFFAVYMADALGLSPTWLQLGALGGASAVGGVARAASAVREGRCSVALVIGADAPSTVWRANYGAYQPEFQSPTGIGGPPGMFGLLSSRYRAQYELDEDALATIAITQREHALLNDNACPKLRKPLTREEYHASRAIADPLRMLDSVMFCDGANAVLVTTDEHADRLGLHKRAYVAGYAEITNFQGDEALPDVTQTGFSIVAPRALAEAGMLGPAEVRMFHPYDDFTIAVLMQLEQIGFCAPGEGSRFVLETDLSYRGALPLNTGGGQISAGQPGLASGGVNVVEAVRQLFGEAGPRQVDDPRNAMVTGLGVIPYGRNWSVSNVLVLQGARA